MNGIYDTVITYDKEMELRRRRNLSASGLEYWAGFTPEQRKEKCAHLHTPAVKAKARRRADRVLRSTAYSRAQAARMRAWHALRYAGVYDRAEWHRQCRQAVANGELKFYLKWVTPYGSSKPELRLYSSADHAPVTPGSLIAASLRVNRRVLKWKV